MAMHQTQLLYFAFKRDLYLVMGVYKLLWIFFNAIPYWVLRSMEKAA